MATEEEVGRRSRDALIEAGLALSSELSLAVVLQRIVDLAAQITDARYGALGVVGPNGRLTDFVTTGLSAQQRDAIGDLPTGRGILGALIHDPRPLRLDDLSRDPRSVGFPPNHPPMHSFLGAPVKAMGRVYGNIYLAEKRGGLSFTREDEEDLVVLASQAGVAVANATLYEQAEERARRLRAIGEVGAAILNGNDLGLLLELIVRLARELAGADLALLATPDESGQHLVVRAADGQVKPEMVGEPIPIHASLAGAAMQLGQVVMVPDASRDERAYQAVIAAGRMGPLMVVPLSARGRSLGSLSIANLEGGHPFSEESRVVVETFADQAAVAMDYARAREASERVAIMDDRERIAKELHDGIIQSLFAVGMNLQATAVKLGESDAADRVERAVAEIDHVIRDLRNYIFGLRPGILADRQLDQALRAVANEVGSGVDVTIEIDPALAAQLATRATDVIQLAREGLSNAIRHGRPRSCRLVLRREGRSAYLEVIDDGEGFEPDGVRLGQGLTNMRNRVEGLGGRFELASRPGEGTRLSLQLPLH